VKTAKTSKKKSQTSTSSSNQSQDDAQAYILPRAEGQSPRGRQLMFQEEIADIVLDRLSNGESLRKICLDPNMPDGSTIRKWLSRNADFARQYAYARDEQADTLFDETIFIADALPEDATSEQVQVARVQIDVRKWAAGKLRPKKYGDMLKHEVTGADGGAIAMQAVNVTQLDYDQREQLQVMLEQIALPSPDEDDL